MRKLGFQILIIIIFGSFFQKAMGQVNLLSGLIAFYPCTGNAVDSSGNGHDGTVNNATLTADRYGRANSAYYVDGTKKGITIPALGDFNATGVTISIWVKTTKSSSAIQVVKGTIGTFYLNVYKTGAFLATFDGTINDNNASSVSTSKITTGNWVNLIATNDGSTTKIYVNGNLENSYPETLKTGGSNFVIANKNFVGSIDDIRIYSRALSTIEVTALYNFSY
jgi:hypothetical protein